MRNVLRRLLSGVKDGPEKRRLEKRLRQDCDSYDKARKEVKRLGEEILAELKKQGVLIDRRQVWAVFGEYCRQRKQHAEVKVALRVAIMHALPGAIFLSIKPLQDRWKQDLSFECLMCPHGDACPGAPSAELVSGKPARTR